MSQIIAARAVVLKADNSHLLVVCVVCVVCSVLCETSFVRYMRRLEPLTDLEEEPGHALKSC